MEQGSKNPVVPPNLDLPEGTIWRLDVLASADALKSPITYGKTPKGTFQAYPESSSAPELEKGETYHLVLLGDPGLALVNCEFEFGAAQATRPTTKDEADAGATKPPASTSDAGSSDPVHSKEQTSAASASSAPRTQTAPARPATAPSC